MRSFLYAILAALIVLMVIVTKLVERGAEQSGGVEDGAAFQRVHRNYLFVYCWMVAGDWLQGPYVYALYSSYGFSKHDIAVLFVGGFGSSMVFGTFAGAAADRLGRKRACQLYCTVAQRATHSARLTARR